MLQVILFYFYGLLYKYYSTENGVQLTILLSYCDNNKMVIYMIFKCFI